MEKYANGREDVHVEKNVYNGVETQSTLTCVSLRLRSTMGGVDTSKRWQP